MIKDGDGPKFPRDVTRRTNRGRRALAYFSRKNNSTEVRVESGLEKDVGLLLEADPRVISYRAQPFSLELDSNAILTDQKAHVKKAGTKPRFYTPDFVCRLANGSLLAIEAKGETFLKDFEARSEEITLGLQGHGMDFLVLPDDHLNKTVIKNITRLHALRANYQDQYVEACSQVVSELLGNQPQWQVERLSQHFTEGKTAVLCALLTGVLTTDLKECLFSNAATVWAAHGDLQHFEVLEIG
ncbi:TPA: hypothetical protein L4605_004332 [Pseudomonas aeruginosa]|uniref:TnsA endonuclease N-terminal domain-containing protein n=1 Tax=Pseudomonas aeruginosa TaxID=287 RepID=UPI001CBAAE1B|nr:TnsA endonuclease N-terminal domain-containing protein [Pseudomonas aeruginosa]HBO2993412.1 hypothetical protein [Pseudomonas aeruginosa]HBO5656564.1 hypothetical protein [Pseudomonas aeruginosa]HCI1863527.1 hypothetical protein [Pseudomonas aeruginosa]HCI2647553.1 hypothetical protein [Pseudomonas aeruginosa]